MGALRGALRRPLGGKGLSTLPRTSCILYAKASNNGVDRSGNGNSFTAISGSWALGTFVGTMPNSSSIKTAIGHVTGVADWAYGADDLPITGLTQATITANNNNFNFLVSSKGVAIYGSPDTLATATQLRADRAMKLLPYNQPTAFFNGVDSPVSSRTTDNNGVYRSTADTATAAFTGGPQWVPDSTGALKLSPTNHMGRQGMRVLATLADYASVGITTTAQLIAAGALGSELVTVQADREFSSDTGFWLKGAGWQIGGDVASCVDVSTDLKTANLTLTIGKRYVICANATGYSGSAFFTLRVGGTNSVQYKDNGDYIVDLIATSSAGNTSGICQAAGLLRLTIDNISIRELIPTYYDTALDNTPIVTSVNQATRTEASAGVYTPSTTLKRYNPANPLTMPGFLCEPARSTYAKLPAEPATQTTTSLANGAYCLWVEGTGSFQASAGTAAATGGWGSAATAGAPITFTVTTAGTVVLTKTGTVTWVQLELGAFPTSRIDNAASASSVTRAATVLTYPTAGKIRSNDMAFRLIVVPSATGQATCLLFGSQFDVGNRYRLMMNASSLILQKVIAGNYEQISVAYAHTANTPIEIAFTFTALGMHLTYRVYSGGVWLAWSSVSSSTTALAKVNAVLGTTFQLGCLTDTGQFTGNISLFETLPIPTGITDPLGWAKKEWGIV